MGIASDRIADNWHAALAALAWQVELGVDEAITDAPLNRYDLPEAAARPPGPPPVVAQSPASSSSSAPAPVAATAFAPEAVIAAAQKAAAAASNLASLHAALAAFEGCELKRGARNTVFADGNPAARVMILTEAPEVEEDRSGKPFVGAVGQMLDRMFAAIGMARDSTDPATAIYLTPVLPWKPPGDRDPTPAEIAMLSPFVQRHIALVQPKVILAMGNTALFALTGQKGILRARGTWGSAHGIAMLPMVHPKYLQTTPAAKREAWADLLALHARLKTF